MYEWRINMKILKYLRKPKLVLLRLAATGRIHINDELFLKIQFKERMKEKLNLDLPKTFNEKLQWLKIHDRNPEYTEMVDKYEAKKHVADIIGEKYIIPTLGVYDKFDEIDFDELPNRFVIKCTHDSGGLVICKDKSSFDIVTAKKKIEKSLKRNFYYAGREWPYKNVKPRIIIEKYMANDEEVLGLTDYKVMCFNGKAKIIFTCTERFSAGLKVTFFDLDWHKLPFERHYPSSNKNILKPKCLDEMIELSEKMSKDIPFVRIDWYEVGNELYFGEYTFYPGNGMEEFTPTEWDERLGDMIDLGSVEK